MRTDRRYRRVRDSTGMAIRSPLGAAVTLAALEEDPHPVHAALRPQEPVAWLPALDGWLVTRRDLALAAMRDTAAPSTGRPPPPPSAPGSPPPWSARPTGSSTGSPRTARPSSAAPSP